MMREKQSLMNRAGYYVAKHMEMCRLWDKGDIKGIWQETDGTVYISYENGQWFRYREEDGRVTIILQI